MAGETTITVIGNLTADPELRYTNGGAQVVSFTIASTPRTLDRATNEWKDGNSLFLNCSAWRDLADHIAQSLTKGTRVIAQGNLSQRSYQANDGTNRTVVELTVTEIGPALTRSTAQVTRAQFTGASANTGSFGQVPASVPASAPVTAAAAAAPVQAPTVASPSEAAPIPAGDPWADSPATSDPTEIPF